MRSEPIGPLKVASALFSILAGYLPTAMSATGSSPDSPLSIKAGPIPANVLRYLPAGCTVACNGSSRQTELNHGLGKARFVVSPPAGNLNGIGRSRTAQA